MFESEFDDLRAFSRADVAERLGVSLTSVDRLIAAGELATIRPPRRGRLVRVPAESLRAYIYGGDAR